MANPIKSLIGQTAIYGVSSIVGRFVNYLLIPFYSYIFATNEYGMVTELTAYVAIFLVLLTYGMETAFFRFCQNDEYSRKTVYSTTISSLIVSSVIFVVLVFLFGSKISDLINYSNNPEYVILLGCTVALDAFSAIPFAKLRIENKAKRFAVIKFANILINVFLNIFFLFLLPRIFGLNNFIYRIFYPEVHIGYIFIAYFLTSLFTLVLLAPEISAAFKDFKIDFRILKDMLKYSFPILIAGLAGMFIDSLDRILFKHLIHLPQNFIESLNINGLTPHKYLQLKDEYIMGQLGIYGANAKIAVIMTLFLQAFRYAAEPFFFNYSKKEDSRIIYAKVMKYFVTFSLFVFLGVTFFIDIIKYMIGPNYRSGLGVIPMLLLGKIFFGIVFNLSIWYKLKNLTKYGAYLSIIGAITSVGMNIILIPHFGYIGAAWASFGAYFVMMAVSFVLEYRNFAIPYEYKSIGMYFSVSICFFLINYYSRLFTEYYIILNFLMITGFVYLFIWNEKIRVLSLVKSLKR